MLPGPMYFALNTFPSRGRPYRENISKKQVNVAER